MLAFVVSSMLAMGLGLTVGGIIAPLRDVRRVVLSLLANFVLVPLAAFAGAYFNLSFGGSALTGRHRPERGNRKRRRHHHRPSRKLHESSP